MYFRKSARRSGHNAMERKSGNFGNRRKREGVYIPILTSSAQTPKTKKRLIRGYVSEAIIVLSSQRDFQKNLVLI
jgi:hypothetical protein